MLLEIPGFWYAMSIMVWILLALLVVTMISDAWLHIVYYKWDKEEKQKKQVGEIIDAKLNPGGGILEEQN